MHKLPNIDPFRQRYNELELELADPDIFKDSEKASRVSREHNRVGGNFKLHENASLCLKEIIDAQDMLNDPELQETAKEEIEHCQKNGLYLKRIYSLPCYPLI